MQDLAGRVAIVTGASSGIGRASCVELARAGVQLVAVGRDHARLADTQARVLAAGGLPALALALDVRSEADMAAMAQATLDRFGRIDILLHSAGVLRAAGASLRTTMQLSLPEWDEVLDINLRGSFLANRAVLPAMLAAGRGDILNLSSMSGLAGIAFDAPYCASKFALMGLSEALAEEARMHGVRVQVLAPGRFATEVLQQTGPIPHPDDLPPPERVAQMLHWMLRLPDDTRLLNPVLAPADQRGPARWAEQRGPARWAELAPASQRAHTPARNTAQNTAHNAAHNTAHKESEMSESIFSAATDLAGKVVIVTGGAGGIGLATARSVAALGGHVVLADLDPQRVAAAVAEVEAVASGGAACLGQTIDVRQEADHQALVRATLERFGRIDALIACAGILRLRDTPPKLLVDVSLEEWDQVIDINLKGVFLSNRAVLPTLVAQRSGTIINLSSISGLQGRAYDGPYCASKFGVIGLSQAVADEVRSFGVKVQALMPAAVATPMWEQNKPAPMPGDAVPAQRVADLIVFMLLQPDDTMIVGPVIAPVGARRRKAAAKPAAE